MNVVVPQPDLVTVTAPVVPENPGRVSLILSPAAIAAEELNW